MAVAIAMVMPVALTDGGSDADAIEYDSKTPVDIISGVQMDWMAGLLTGPTPMPYTFVSHPSEITSPDTYGIGKDKAFGIDAKDGFRVADTELTLNFAKGSYFVLECDFGTVYMVEFSEDYTMKFEGSISVSSTEDKVFSLLISGGSSVALTAGTDVDFKLSFERDNVASLGTVGSQDEWVKFREAFAVEDPKERAKKLSELDESQLGLGFEADIDFKTVSKYGRISDDPVRNLTFLVKGAISADARASLPLADGRVFGINVGGDISLTAEADEGSGKTSNVSADLDVGANLGLVAEGVSDFIKNGTGKPIFYVDGSVSASLSAAADVKGNGDGILLKGALVSLTADFSKTSSSAELSVTCDEFALDQEELDIRLKDVSASVRASVNPYPILKSVPLAEILLYGADTSMLEAWEDGDGKFKTDVPLLNELATLIEDTDETHLLRYMSMKTFEDADYSPKQFGKDLNARLGSLVGGESPESSIIMGIRDALSKLFEKEDGFPDMEMEIKVSVGNFEATFGDDPVVTVSGSGISLNANLSFDGEGVKAGIGVSAYRIVLNSTYDGPTVESIEVRDVDLGLDFFCDKKESSLKAELRGDVEVKVFLEDGTPWTEVHADGVHASFESSTSVQISATGGIDSLTVIQEGVSMSADGVKLRLALPSSIVLQADEVSLSGRGYGDENSVAGVDGGIRDLKVVIPIDGGDGPKISLSGYDAYISLMDGASLRVEASVIGSKVEQSISAEGGLVYLDDLTVVAGLLSEPDQYGDLLDIGSVETTVSGTGIVLGKLDVERHRYVGTVYVDKRFIDEKHGYDLDVRDMHGAVLGVTYGPATAEPTLSIMVIPGYSETYTGLSNLSIEGSKVTVDDREAPVSVAAEPKKYTVRVDGYAEEATMGEEFELNLPKDGEELVAVIDENGRAYGKVDGSDWSIDPYDYARDLTLTAVYAKSLAVEEGDNDLGQDSVTYTDLGKDKDVSLKFSSGVIVKFHGKNATDTVKIVAQKTMFGDREAFFVIVTSDGKEVEADICFPIQNRDDTVVHVDAYGRSADMLTTCEDIEGQLYAKAVISDYSYFYIREGGDGGSDNTLMYAGAAAAIIAAIAIAGAFLFLRSRKPAA